MLLTSCRTFFHIFPCLFMAAFINQITSSATAQVFTLGPSDSSLFDTVINLPPDLIVGYNQSIEGSTQLNIDLGGRVERGFEVNAGSELNLMGGAIGDLFGGGFFFPASLQANGGSEINIMGGTVGSYFLAGSGSYVDVRDGVIGDGFNVESGAVVHVSGGKIGGRFNAANGSHVTISGGSFGRNFLANDGSDVELLGGDFYLNGAGYFEPSITLVQGDTFSGRLSDGSSFVFYSDGSRIGVNNFKYDYLKSVNLRTVPLPLIDTTPIDIDSTVGAPKSLSTGQILTVREGAVLADNFTARNAVLVVEGGLVGGGSRFAGSLVNMNSGRLSGSDSSTSSLATSGSVLNVRGGIVGGFDVIDGSRLNITGGVIDGDYSTGSGGEIRISGGYIREIQLPSAGNVGITGDEFKLNGVSYNGEAISLEHGDTFTGVLSDGSPFIHVNSYTHHRLIGLKLFTTDLRPVEFDSLDIVERVDGISGLRAGQRLTIRGGGELDEEFAVLDARIDVEGGDLSGDLKFAASELNINSGYVSAQINATLGSVINIRSGIVNGRVDANRGSEVNISGGTISSFLTTRPDSVLNITGGVFSGHLDLASGEINLSGGVISPHHLRVGSSELNIIGTEFFLDDVALDSFGPGENYDFVDRNGVLSGVLMDGSPFSFVLSDINYSHISSSAQVTLIRVAVPEPASLSLIAVAALCGVLGSRKQNCQA